MGSDGLHIGSEPCRKFIHPADGDQFSWLVEVSQDVLPAVKRSQIGWVLGEFTVKRVPPHLLARRIGFKGGGKPFLPESEIPESGIFSWLVA